MLATVANTVGLIIKINGKFNIIFQRAWQMVQKRGAYGLLKGVGALLVKEQRFREDMILYCAHIHYLT